MGTSLSTRGGLTDSQKARAKAEGLTNSEYLAKMLKNTNKEIKALKPKKKESKGVIKRFGYHKKQRSL